MLVIKILECGEVIMPKQIQERRHNENHPR